MSKLSVQQDDPIVEDGSQLRVSMGVYLTFNSFIDFQQALELGEDGGEAAGLKVALRDFIKDEGIIGAMGNAAKMEWEIDEVTR